MIFNTEILSHKEENCKHIIVCKIKIIYYPGSVLKMERYLYTYKRFILQS